LMQSHLEEAERALDQALQISNQSEARLFRPLVKSGLGNVYLQRGWSQRACEILLQAKDEADELGHETSKVAVSTYLGTAYSQLGQTEHGLSLIRAGQAGAKQKGYGGVEALAAFAEANVLAMQGPLRVEDALGCLQRTAEIAQRLEARPLLGSVKGVRARLLAASGRTSEAQDELIAAIDLFSKSKMTVHLERAKVTLSKFSDT
jgi:ATP/maltotriose-dependent transcriptional regulator MalT